MPSATAPSPWGVPRERLGRVPIASYLRLLPGRTRRDRRWQAGVAAGPARSWFSSLLQGQGTISRSCVPRVSLQGCGGARRSPGLLLTPLSAAWSRLSLLSPAVSSLPHGPGRVSAALRLTRVAAVVSGPGRRGMKEQ